MMDISEILKASDNWGDMSWEDRAKHLKRRLVGIEEMLDVAWTDIEDAIKRNEEITSDLWRQNAMLEHNLKLLARMIYEMAQPAENEAWEENGLLAFARMQQRMEEKFSHLIFDNAPYFSPAATPENGGVSND